MPFSRVGLIAGERPAEQKGNFVIVIVYTVSSRSAAANRLFRIRSPVIDPNGYVVYQLHNRNYMLTSK